jgi:hypothetical protein
MKKIKLPEPPLIRRVTDGSISRCPKCQSSMKISLNPFKKSKGCIQPICDNYYEKN